jgi:hypothetical protein
MSQPSATARAREDERRVYPRFLVRNRLLGLFVATDRPVRIRDIGVGGFATETLEPLSTGTVEAVRLTTVADQSAVVRARGLHSWPSCGDDGLPCFVTGFSFVDLDVPETRRLVEALVGAVTSPALWRDAPQS